MLNRDDDIILPQLDTIEILPCIVEQTNSAGNILYKQFYASKDIK
jgi:hypothetical protein